MSKKIKLGRQKIKSKLKLFGAAIDIPNDPFSKLSHISLHGNQEAIIDGCFGIEEYSDCLVSINIGKMRLKFIGCDFNISEYSNSNIVLRGVIKSIDFC